MYNEEQKLQYLETIESESSRKYASNTLQRFEQAEESVGLDIAEWDVGKIYSTIESMYIFDFGTMKQYLSILSGYIKYVRSRGSNNRGDFIPKLDISCIDISQNIRDIIIRSPFDLQNELRKAIDPSQGYYIVAAACFAWLGIDIRTMPLIKDTAVDFTLREIVDANCDIDIRGIDSAILGILREYWETEEAIRWHHAACRVYPLNNGKFLHLMVGENSKKDIGPVKVRSIQMEFTSICKAYEKNTGEQSPLSYSNLLRSGGLYRIYQLEKSGVDVFSGKSDDILAKTYAAPGKTFDIRSLYRQYKRAFDLD